MKVRALVSFSGAATMAVGEIKDITEKEVLKDLLNAGYVKKIGKNKDFEEEESDADLEESAENTSDKEIPDEN